MGRSLLVADARAVRGGAGGRGAAGIIAGWRRCEKVHARRAGLRWRCGRRHNRAMRTRRITLGILLAGLAAGSSVGCDTGLVTDYQPRRLGDSPAARRAYYAGKYTPQAHAAGQEKAEELHGRRPGAPVGGGGGPAPY